jgi:hypothetical protein
MFVVAIIYALANGNLFAAFKNTFRTILWMIYDIS